MNRRRTGSKQLIREMNQAAVLGLARSSDSTSRADIARLTGLSPATVSGITGALLDHGLLVEAATGESIGGRRPIMLEIVPDAGYAIGVKITDQDVLGVLCDLQANVVARHSQRLATHDVTHVLDVIEDTVSILTPAAGGRSIHGIGIGLAGVIDTTLGIVRHATYTTWQNVPLAALLEDRLDTAVIIDNDVNALVSIERWFGAGHEVDNLLLISVGRGVGLSMVFDGKLYRGTRGGAGEFGHIKIESNNNKCECGSYGCLEAETCDDAVARRVSQAHGREVTSDQALQLIRDGDPLAGEIYASVAAVLGKASANLINVLSPDLVVVTGEGPGGFSGFQSHFLAAFEGATFHGLASQVEIAIEDWDEESWARGAACLVLGELFEPSDRTPGKRSPSLLP